jgi:hypothetical protein
VVGDSGIDSPSEGHRLESREHDEVVSEDMRPYAAAVRFEGTVKATCQLEAAFEERDAAFDPGTETLQGFEDARALAPRLLRRAPTLLGDTNISDDLFELDDRIHASVEAFVGCQGFWACTKQPPVVLKDVIDERRVIGTLFEDTIAADELVFDLLQEDHVAELERPEGLPRLMSSVCGSKMERIFSALGTDSSFKIRRWA